MSDLLRIIDYFTVCWRIDSHFSLSQEECFTKKSYLYISRGWNTGWQTEAQFIFDYMQVNCIWYVFSCSNCDNLHDNINFFFLFIVFGTIHIKTALKNTASNVKFPSLLPCWLLWNLTFWTHASLPWRRMKANLWKLRQALVYSRISLFLINFSHNAQIFPELHKRFRSAGAVCLRHCFERWEVLTQYLIMFPHVWMASV